MKSDLEGFKAVLYARVSTDDKGQTNETQIREMKNWCESKGVVIIEIFTDEVSGKNLERPGFRSMIGRIAMGNIDILLAWDVSRLTRNNELSKIESMVAPFGCQIRFVTIASDPGTFASEIETNMKECFSKEERKLISTRTKLGMVTAKAKGVHCGRPVAIVLDTDLDSTPGVKLEGKNPTRILTMEEIVGKSAEGLTVKQASRIWEVQYTSLIRFLKSKGLFELFRTVPKGGSTKRVFDSNTSERKTGVE